MAGFQESLWRQRYLLSTTICQDRCIQSGHTPHCFTSGSENKQLWVTKPHALGQSNFTKTADVLSKSLTTRIFTSMGTDLISIRHPTTYILLHICITLRPYFFHQDWTYCTNNTSFKLISFLQEHAANRYIAAISICSRHCMWDWRAMKELEVLFWGHL